MRKKMNSLCLTLISRHNHTQSTETRFGLELKYTQIVERMKQIRLMQIMLQTTQEIYFFV